MTTPAEINAELIARTAYRLATHLDRLEAIKYTRRPPPEARVMAPTFGPTAPGNATAIDIDWQIWDELKAWCTTLNTEVQSRAVPPPGSTTSDYARWAAINANQISHHPEADTFLEELARWHSMAERLTGILVQEQAPSWQLAPVIIQAVARFGVQLSRHDLSDMSHRGHIGSQRRMTKHGWRNTYLLADVLSHLQERGKL